MQMSELKIYEKATYTAIDGTKSAWGDAYGYTSLVDGNDHSKWCSADTHEGYDNGWWIVFKSSDPITPYFYNITTADDSDFHPERNWKAWKIYAANFDSDEEATKGAEGWVLIAANFATVKFGLSEDVTEAYSYFKIEVPEIVGGNCMQMSEFDFGIFADEFEEVNICAPGYATFFIPEKDVEVPEGVQAFTGVIDGDRVILTEVTGSIPAGTAVVLKGAEGVYQFNYTTGASAVGENDLIGTDEPIQADGNQYVLAQKDGTIGFYQAEIGTTIPAGKAYLIGANGVKGYTLNGETAIEQVQNVQEVQNVQIYDLSGRRVEKAIKGIYIINGKMIVK